MATSHNDDTDMDSVLSGIVLGNDSPENKTARPSPATSGKVHKLRNARTHNTSRRNAAQLMLFILLPAIIIGSFVTFREQLVGLFDPPSPFTKEQSKLLPFSPLYPTRLPGSFKLETNSISPPGQIVLFYIISDDNGRQVAVTQQQPPRSLNLSPLFDIMNDKQEVQTEFGTATIGLLSDGKVNAHLIAGDVWFLINLDKDAMSYDELRMLLQSLKRG